MLLLSAASCDTDRLVSTGTPQTQILTATAEAYAPSTATRTQVGEVGADGALSLLWSPGDRIGVFSAQTANAPFTNESDAPGASAAFAGQLDGTPLYAYYPYAAGATDLTAIPVEIPTEQTYADESSIARYDVKAGEVTPSAGGYFLQLRQLAALVRFEFDLTGVETLGADERVQDVTIHQDGTSVPMAGEFTFNLADLDAGLTAGNATMDGITLRFENPPAAGEKFTAYAVVAPGRHKGNKWCCVFTTDRHVVTFYTTALCDFEAGMYYTVPLNFEVLERNEATYEELPEEEPEEETANCYIVTETGAHDFKATVIGNGEKGIIKGAGFHTENPYINPQSAGLLWQDTEGFVSDVTLRDGRVHYQVNSLTGNAVIAVYSGPDRTGDILWSWHIWGTGGEMPVAEDYTNKAGGHYRVMDRTLGAWSKTSYTATLYQWGRKDPFPNASTYYVDGQAVDIRDQFPAYESDQNTIETSVRHAGELVYYYVQGSTDWLREHNHFLWGDTTFYRGVLEDAEFAANEGWSHGKTIYDPSPVGWRVANKYTWTGFVSRTGCTTATGSFSEEGRLELTNYVKFDHGYYFKRNAADTEGAYYPMTGSRLPYTGSTCVSSMDPDKYTVGNRAGYWSASPQKSELGYAPGTFTYNAYYMWLGPSKAGPSTDPDAGGSVIEICKYGSRQNAYAVRCVVDE